jgi:lysozyme family protein
MGSSFEPAFRFMLGDEGGYANNPSDSGEETWRGVSRANWPHWAGWQIIDAVKAELGLGETPTRQQWGVLTHELAKHPELQDLVKSFYTQPFWPEMFEQLQSQAIASKLFDEGVNMGLAHGAMCLQNAITKAGTPCVADGKFGQQTLDAANGYSEAALMPLFVEAIKDRYLEIVKHTPSDAEFLPDWLRRAERMPAEYEEAT